MTCYDWLEGLEGRLSIPTSQNPDTPEGLECQLSIRIRIIPEELPHSTRLELGKLRRT
jgi:hypothetical protein